MKIKNIKEKIELLDGIIFCLEELKGKLEKLQDAEDFEEKEDIKESIEDCLTEMTLITKLLDE